MPTSKDTRSQAEELVRRILSNNFNQQIDPETVRMVADKVSKAVASNAPSHHKKSPDQVAM